MTGIVLSTLFATATDGRAGFPVELGPELSGLSTPLLTDPSLVCLGVCLAGLKWPRSRQPREPLLPPACSSVLSVLSAPVSHGITVCDRPVTQVSWNC